MAPKTVTEEASGSKASGSGDKRRRDNSPEGDASEAESAGGVRQRTANRQAGRTATIYHPGDPKKANSFVTFQSKEALCASYNGYDDVGALRRLVVSGEFLQFFHRFDQKWSLSMNVKQAFTIILNEFIEGEQDVDFPLRVQDLDRYEMPDEKQAKYTREEDHQRHCYLAHILIVMKHLWSESGGEDVEELEDDDKDENYFREALIKKHAHIDSVPIAASSDSVIRPYLVRSGFREEESNLEPYNRVWNLLRYFKYVTASEAHWSSKFGNLGTWDRKTIITAQNTPDWMRVVSSAPLAPHPLAQVHATLPPRRFKLLWKRGGKGEDDKALEAYLDAKEGELELPNPKIDADGDPRIHDRSEFRDAIRLQYDCVGNRLQLSKLIMKIVPEHHDQNDERPQDWDIDTCDWEDLTTALETSSEEVEVIVKLRMLDDGEDDVMESLAPPSQLKGTFLEVRPSDKTIRPANPHRKAEKVVSDDDFLRAAGGRTSRPKSYKPDPAKHFDLQTDREAYLKHFDGSDVNNSEQERKRWLEKTLKQVLPTFGAKARPKRQKKENVTSKKNGKQASRGADIMETCERACREGELAAIHGADGQVADAQDLDEQQRYFSIQGAFTGTEEQTGPPLDLCLTALGMVLTASKDLNDKREKYGCTLLPAVKETFFPWQVTGAAFILLCLYGTIPLPDEHANQPAVQASLRSLIRLQTFGCVVADTTGIGKTKESLLALAFSMYFRDEKDSSGTSVYMPALIAVPSTLVVQWVREIKDHWPFRLVISYDKDVIDENESLRVIPSKMMKQFAETGDLKGLDERFRRNFDGAGHPTRETIVLTSIDTHAERTSYIETVHHDAVSFDPPRYDQATGEEKFAEKAYDEHFCRSHMAGRWSVVIVDEAHGIKNIHTQNFAAIYTLKATYKILLTATPMQNNQSDVIGLLTLLWDTVRDVVDSDSKCKSLAKNVGEGFKLYFDWLHDPEQSNLKLNDTRRLMALSPHRVRSLLQTSNPQLIKHFYHYTETLVTLRRSPASTIWRTETGSGERILLRDNMTSHTIKMVDLQRTPAQEKMYQWLHREYAERYLKELSSGNATPKKSNEHPITAAGELSVPLDMPQVFYPIIPLRDLDILNASTLLARFNETMKEQDIGTLVPQMDYWREKGLDAITFAKHTLREGDPIMQTRKDFIKLFCTASPIFVLICQWILKHIWDEEKLLVIEQVPIIAWYWEIACQLLLIETTTMHAGLDQRSRTQVVDDFNAAGGLKILIIMYNVGGQGINLQKQCRHAIVATPAISYARFLQAIGRIIRVDQPREVEIVCAFMKNSHSAWRLYRQSSKHIVELATRAHDPEVEELLVELLNEHLDKCKALLNTEVGRQMAIYISGQKCTPQDEADVPSAIDEAYASGRPTRNVKAIKRFNPYHYDTHGAEMDLTKPDLARKAWQKQREGLGYDALDEDDEATMETADDSGAYEDTGQTYVTDMSKSTSDYLLQLDKLRAIEKTQPTMTDEAETLMAMVRLAQDGECTAADLEDPLKLRLGLLLLYHARIGKRNVIESSSIHIRYDKLPIRTIASEKYADSLQLDQALVTAAFTKAGVRTSSQVKAKRKKIKLGPTRNVKTKAVVADDAGEPDDEDVAFDAVEQGADDMVAAAMIEYAEPDAEALSPVRSSALFKKLESAYRGQPISRLAFKAIYLRPAKIRWAHHTELSNAIFEQAGAESEDDAITVAQALDALQNLHESYWPMLGR